MRQIAELHERCEQLQRTAATSALESAAANDVRAYASALEHEVAALQEELRASHRKLKAHKRYQLKLVSSPGPAEGDVQTDSKLKELALLLQKEKAAHEQVSKTKQLLTACLHDYFTYTLGGILVGRCSPSRRWRLKKHGS